MDPQTLRLRMYPPYALRKEVGITDDEPADIDRGSDSKRAVVCSDEGEQSRSLVYGSYLVLDDVPGPRVIEPVEGAVGAVARKSLQGVSRSQTSHLALCC